MEESCLHCDANSDAICRVIFCFSFAEIAPFLSLIVGGYLLFTTDFSDLGGEKSSFAFYNIIKVIVCLLLLRYAFVGYLGHFLPVEIYRF